MSDWGINPHVDDSVWQNTQNIRQGIRLAIGDNEFSECIQGVVAVTNSGASYEKSLHISQIVTHDPSDYSQGITRDACADDCRGSIAPFNLTGRVWGAYSDAVVQPLSDGLAIGKETGIENHGSDQPLVDQATSKYGHLITSKGAKPATAGIYLTAGKYHHGMVMRNDSLTDGGALITLFKAGTNTPLFQVNAQGELIIKGKRVVVETINGKDYLVLA